MDSPIEEIVPEFIIVKLFQGPSPSPILIDCPAPPVAFIIVPKFSKVPPVPLSAEVWGKSTTLADVTVDLRVPRLVIVGFIAPLAFIATCVAVSIVPVSVFVTVAFVVSFISTPLCPVLLLIVPELVIVTEVESSAKMAKPSAVIVPEFSTVTFSASLRNIA